MSRMYVWMLLDILDDGKQSEQQLDGFSWHYNEHCCLVLSVTVSNVKIVQCMIFRWNPWTTNWIRHVWSRGPLILGHGVFTILYNTVRCVNDTNQFINFFIWIHKHLTADDLNLFLRIKNKWTQKFKQYCEKPSECVGFNVPCDTV